MGVHLKATLFLYSGRVLIRNNKIDRLNVKSIQSLIDETILYSNGFIMILISSLVVSWYLLKSLDDNNLSEVNVFIIRRPSFNYLFGIKEKLIRTQIEVNCINCQKLVSWSHIEFSSTIYFCWKMKLFCDIYVSFLKDCNVMQVL